MVAAREILYKVGPAWRALPNKYEDRWVPWFRGEPANSDTPLLPKLYRESGGGAEAENDLLQFFRSMGPHPFYGAPPGRKDTDQWLYLAQHVGLPTRLLDWTEGALAVLFFSLEEQRPRVWMLHPLELNAKSRITQFELPWHNPLQHNPKRRRKGLPYKTNASLRAAWQKGHAEFHQTHPIAFYPTYIHPRLAAQRSCFTIHGENSRRLDKSISKGFLRSFDIDPTSRVPMYQELRVLVQ